MNNGYVWIKPMLCRLSFENLHALVLPLHFLIFLLKISREVAFLILSRTKLQTRTSLCVTTSVPNFTVFIVTGVKCLDVPKTTYVLPSLENVIHDR